MRLSIIATPTQPEASIAPAHAIDGRLIRARLERADTGFDVVQADPGQDLAEQIEGFFASRTPGAGDAVMLHAACPLLLSVEGELFLCLDPTQPHVGDALADVAAVLRERAPGPKLLIVDGVEARIGVEPQRAEAIMRAAEAAVEPRTSGIELIVVLRAPPAEGEAQASPLTEALVAELDALGAGRSLTAEEMYERAARRLAAASAIARYMRREQQPSFALVALAEGAELADIGVAAFRGEEGAIPKPPPLPRRSEAHPSITPPEDIDLSWGEDDFADPFPQITVTRKLAAPPGASLLPPPISSSSADAPPPSSRSGHQVSPISGREISPFARYAVEGELLASQGDHAGAIAEFRKALSVLGPTGDPDARAEMYVRIGGLRKRKGDTDDAISDFEKALALRPGHRAALESLIELCAQEQDWRGLLSAEERLLLTLQNPDLRFERLVEFGVRWEEVADKPARAKLLYERAREIRPHDPALLGRIRQLASKVSQRGQR
jgi:tetratricopeptide (TPR) repeat protein